MRTIRVKRGDSTSCEVTFTNADDDPLDLTGATIYFTVKESWNDTDAHAVIQKTYTNGDDTGILEIEITSDDTAELLGTYFYDVQFSKDDEVLSSNIGRMVVSQDITLS